MRRVVLLLTATGLALLLVGARGGPAPAQTAPGEVVADASCRSPIGTLYAVLGPETAFAQTFTAEHTGRLTSVQVAVGDFYDDPTGILMGIHAVDASGAPTGPPLATDEIPASEIRHVRYGPTTAYFDPGVPVEAGRQYAIALTTTGGPTDLLNWAGSTGDPCPGRLYVDYGFTLGGPFVYDTYFARGDVYFSTFVTLAPVPRTKADCKKGGHEAFGFENQGRCVKAVNHAA